MARKYTIRKATHKAFGPEGSPALAVMQMRGDTVWINRYENGQHVATAKAVGSCADHLTGYGRGVAADDARRVESLQGAWRYMFGPDVPVPLWCEVHTA